MKTVAEVYWSDSRWYRYRDTAYYLDRSHLEASPGGFYHATVVGIAIELMAEDIL